MCLLPSIHLISLGFVYLTGNSGLNRWLKKKKKILSFTLIFFLINNRRRATPLTCLPQVAYWLPLVAGYEKTWALQYLCTLNTWRHLHWFLCENLTQRSIPCFHHYSPSQLCFWGQFQHPHFVVCAVADLKLVEIFGLAPHVNLVELCLPAYPRHPEDQHKYTSWVTMIWSGQTWQIHVSDACLTFTLLFSSRLILCSISLAELLISSMCLGASTFSACFAIGSPTPEQIAL